MIKITRRTLFVAASLAPVVALATSRQKTPVLWGDGVHDDTVALAALISGKKVIVPDKARYAVARLRNGSVSLIGGEFILKSSIAEAFLRGPNVMSQVTFRQF